MIPTTADGSLSTGACGRSRVCSHPAPRARETLKPCNVLLYAEGYRPKRTLQHYRTMQCRPMVLGAERKTDAEYLDACRMNRNRVEYEYLRGALADDVRELLEFTRDLRDHVLSWWRATRPTVTSRPR